MSTIPRRGSKETAAMTELEAAAAPLLADGWTVQGAYDHLQGMCDAAICCGHFPGTERLLLVCNECGEAFDSLEPAHAHDHLHDDQHPSFRIEHESEAM